MDAADYVLSDFSAAERKDLAYHVDRCADAVEVSAASSASAYADQTLGSPRRARSSDSVLCAQIRLSGRMEPPSTSARSDSASSQRHWSSAARALQLRR